MSEPAAAPALPPDGTYEVRGVEAVATGPDAARAAFNRKLEPLLSEPSSQMRSSGVMPLTVPAEAAARCAEHLRAQWKDGKLALRGGATDCTGYATYGKTLSEHDAEQQRTHTLLITNPLLPFVRDELPGD